MILILIKGANSFTVNYDYLEGLALKLGFQQLSPYPEAFRAGIDCGPYAEATHFLV